ncbi:MAG: asparagine synthase (glutamine-hydrolyzing) [Gammaproteobacteria bacterium]|nr:asparagine synthase (glutamine-hydrolyzing) [Gammaproteobacteria bacterium]
MCGIAGFLDRRLSYKHPESVLETMASRMNYRGPDDRGVWFEKASGVGFSHTRLSIQDVSAQGHQPMHSTSQRYTITYNGEIYNAPELRDDLLKSGMQFRGRSDTEVILALVEVYGLRRTLELVNGMFAFALWDSHNKTLSLARDRVGIKPLYYGWVNDVFLFASVLSAIESIPSFGAEIDHGALGLFFRFNYVPDPYSIYENIHKLLPGRVLTLRQSDTQSTMSVPECYWNLPKRDEQTCENVSAEIAVTQLDELLGDAVAKQMLSDVPVGAFLSGGIDSSVVVAQMQKHSHHSVKTFSIGFEDSRFNEAEQAAIIANVLGTDHTEAYVSVQDAIDVIPSLTGIYDEPFADTSQIGMYLVSKLASDSVSVCLSGDGGDELFGGYNRHIVGDDLWRLKNRIPSTFRQVIARGLSSISPQTYNSLGDIFDGVLPMRARFNSPGDKLHKLSRVLSTSTPWEMYQSLVSQWHNPVQLVSGMGNPEVMADQHSIFADSGTIGEAMMRMDLLTYLPGDVLTKVDRASMAFSLEARVPLLDHRIIEYANNIRMDLKVSRGQGKWLLRKVLQKYVPLNLFERPKMGFGVPVEQWLRSELRDWAESLLDPVKLQQQGFIDPVPVQKVWKTHLSGKANHYLDIWSILMFQSWLEERQNSNTATFQ